MGKNYNKNAPRQADKGVPIILENIKMLSDNISKEWCKGKQIAYMFELQALKNRLNEICGDMELGR